MIYEVTVTDTATYRIETTSQERAEEQAVEWFDEREPRITTVVVKPDKFNGANS